MGIGDEGCWGSKLASPGPLGSLQEPLFGPDNAFTSTLDISENHLLVQHAVSIICPERPSTLAPIEKSEAHSLPGENLQPVLVVILMDEQVTTQRIQAK